MVTSTMLASVLRGGCLQRVSPVACALPSGAALGIRTSAVKRPFVSASRCLILGMIDAACAKPALLLPRTAARRIQQKAAGPAASGTAEEVTTAASTRVGAPAGSVDAAASGATAEAAAQPTAKVGRLRQLIRDYGAVALGVHIGANSLRPDAASKPCDSRCACTPAARMMAAQATGQRSWLKYSVAYGLPQSC